MDDERNILKPTFCTKYSHSNQGIIVAMQLLWLWGVAEANLKAELQWTTTDPQLFFFFFFFLKMKTFFLLVPSYTEHLNKSIKQWFYSLRRLLLFAPTVTQNISSCTPVAMATASVAGLHAERPSVVLTYRSITLPRHPVSATESHLLSSNCLPIAPWKGGQGRGWVKRCGLLEGPGGEAAVETTSPDTLWQVNNTGWNHSVAHLTVWACSYHKLCALCSWKMIFLFERRKFSRSCFRDF